MSKPHPVGVSLGTKNTVIVKVIVLEVGVYCLLLVKCKINSISRAVTFYQKLISSCHKGFTAQVSCP